MQIAPVFVVEVRAVGACFIIDVFFVSFPPKPKLLQTHVTVWDTYLAGRRRRQAISTLRRTCEVWLNRVLGSGVPRALLLCGISCSFFKLRGLHSQILLGADCACFRRRSPSCGNPFHGRCVLVFGFSPKSQLLQPQPNLRRRTQSWTPEVPSDLDLGAVWNFTFVLQAPRSNLAGKTVHVAPVLVDLRAVGTRFMADVCCCVTCCNPTRPSMMHTELDA